MTIPLFDPPLKPSYGSGLDLVVSPRSVRFGKGYEQVTPVAQRGLRLGRLQWDALDEDGIHYVESFIDQFAGSVGPFAWIPFDKIPSPLGIRPTLTNTAGGSLGTRTYSVRFTWWDATYGETKPCPATLFTPGNNDLLTVTVPPVPSRVEGWRVYVAIQGAGPELLQATVTATTTWVQPASSLIGGNVAPSSNTLSPQMKFVFAGRLQKRRIGPSVWSASLNVLEQLT